ncbi:MAG: hypothetical protein WAW90_03025 [Minisyncoccia bacterium]
MSNLVVTLIVLATLTSASVFYYIKQQSPLTQEVFNTTVDNYATNNVKYAKTAQLPEPLGTLIPIFAPSDIWPVGGIVNQVDQKLNTKVVSATFYVPTASTETDPKTIALIVDFYENLFDQTLSKQGWIRPQRGDSVHTYVPYKKGDSTASLEYSKNDDYYNQSKKESLSILTSFKKGPTSSVTTFTITYSGQAK